VCLDHPNRAHLECSDGECHDDQGKPEAGGGDTWYQPDGLSGQVPTNVAIAAAGAVRPGIAP